MFGLRRCLSLQKFDEAATRLLKLLAVIHNTEDNLRINIHDLPALGVILHVTVISLLKSNQLQQAEIVCEAAITKYESQKSSKLRTVLKQESVEQGSSDKQIAESKCHEFSDDNLNCFEEDVISLMLLAEIQLIQEKWQEAQETLKR